MPAPKCPKCDNHGFEVVQFTPVGQTYRLTMIQCTNCGTAVGTLDPDLQVLRSQVAAMHDGITRIAKALVGLR